MFFIKLAAFVLIFAIPLGVVIGFAAKQFKLGRVSRFPNHSISLRKTAFQLMLALSVPTIISFQQDSAFDPIIVGLFAMLIVFTGLIGYLTYNLLMRGRQLG